MNIVAMQLDIEFYKLRRAMKQKLIIGIGIRQLAQVPITLGGVHTVYMNQADTGKPAQSDLGTPTIFRVADYRER